MANGASRLFSVIKQTGTSDNGSQLVYLTVKTLNPLTFSLGDKLVLDENFYIIADTIDSSKLTIGDIVIAATFNNGQQYFIQDILQATNELVSKIKANANNIATNTADINDLKNKDTYDIKSLTVSDSIISNGRIAGTIKSCNMINTGNYDNPWIKLCDIYAPYMQGRFLFFRILFGDGNNGEPVQNAYIDLTLQSGWNGSVGGRFGCYGELHAGSTQFTVSNCNIAVTSDDISHYSLWLYTHRYYVKPSYIADVDSDVVITHDGKTVQADTPKGTDDNCQMQLEDHIRDITLTRNTNTIGGGSWQNSSAAGSITLQAGYYICMMTGSYSGNGVAVTQRLMFDGSTEMSRMRQSTYCINGLIFSCSSSSLIRLTENRNYTVQPQIYTSGDALVSWDYDIQFYKIG